MNGSMYRPSPKTKHKARQFEKAVAKRYEVRLVFGKDKYATAGERDVRHHSLGKVGFVLAQLDSEMSINLAEPLHFVCPPDAPFIGLHCTSWAIYDGKHHLGSRGVKALRVHAGWTFALDPHPELAKAYRQNRPR